MATDGEVVGLVEGAVVGLVGCSVGCPYRQKVFWTDACAPNAAAFRPNVQARLMQMNEVAISPAQLMVNTNSSGFCI